MASTIIIGDGPAGLSAALFLSKNDHHVTVFGTDGTAMHWAHLHNYLGVPDVGGTAFQQVARDQATGAGANLDDREVTAVRAEDGRFVVSTEDAASAQSAEYLIIAGGKTAGSLAESLGITSEHEGVDVDQDGRTGVDRVYVVGRLARPNRSQAIISAGMGAAAALDILSLEAGEDVHDWDSPPKED